MASSGTYAFSLSLGESVIAAFERVNVRAPSLRQEHMATARREINLLFAELSNRQVNLWKVEQISLDLTDGTATYDIPGRVVMILDAYISLNDGDDDQTDLYVTPISRTQYASYASKSTEGQPTVFWFDRQIEPTVTFYPVPDGNGPYVFNYYACVQMQDAAINGGQTPDIPYLWYDVLVAGLAHRLSRVYAPPLEEQRKKDYDAAWNYAATQNVENTPVTITPSLSSYYR